MAEDRAKFFEKRAEVWRERSLMWENEVKILLKILKINNITLESYRYLFPENQSSEGTP